ncbi:MAG: hypothetical protein SWX82_17565 [Cyanobacteriota bacterium]|nr:hypothetical protein [Cyanobacteriota bacterium]
MIFLGMQGEKHTLIWPRMYGLMQILDFDERSRLLVAPQDECFSLLWYLKYPYIYVLFSGEMLFFL